MKDFTKTKKLIFISLAVLILMIMITPLSFVDLSLSNDNGLATSTYTHYFGLRTRRDIITTSLNSTYSYAGTSSIVFSAENATSSTQSFSYSYSETKTATVNLGASVVIAAVELEAGGSVSYSTTTTISTSLSVPAYTTYDVVMTKIYLNKCYRSVIQNQVWYLLDGWQDYESPYTSYSTVVYTYPRLTATPH